MDVGGEELSARNPLDLLPSGGRAICQQVIASGRPITCEGESLTLPDQSGDRAQYWDWALVPVVDGNGQGKGAVLTLVDVTERQQTEARLKGSLEELRRQNELLRQSARIVSHDLAAPLQSVLGYLELLEEEGPVLGNRNVQTVCRIGPAQRAPDAAQDPWLAGRCLGERTEPSP